MKDYIYLITFSVVTYAFIAVRYKRKAGKLNDQERLLHIEAVNLTYVNELNIHCLNNILKRLVASGCVAVDVEHTMKQSYDGRICLIQFSTVFEDIIIGTLFKVINL